MQDRNEKRIINKQSSPRIRNNSVFRFLEFETGKFYQHFLGISLLRETILRIPIPGKLIKMICGVKVRCNMEGLCVYASYGEYIKFKPVRHQIIVWLPYTNWTTEEIPIRNLQTYKNRMISWPVCVSGSALYREGCIDDRGMVGVW